ncbi:MAG: hypothetical protein K0R90_608 [Oscillospiraceae bacterium]|jgi:uncharacterized membrane protein|nr:hypothetical protein [Oscillospiraceae bacterium]
MKKVREYVTIYTIGAVGYSILEILWRGFTHWTMAITGGLCFVFVYLENVKFKRAKLWKKCLLGSAIITTMEFSVGCIVNLVLKWNVWDYSRMYLNIFGQICILYSAIWFVLCMPLCFLSSFIKKKVFSR